MAILIQMRWALLIAAMICVATFVLAMFFPTAPLVLALPVDAALWLAIVLQPLGVFAMSRRMAARGMRGGWPAIVGYLAALAWLIVLISAQAAVAAGPGGGVYGILITLPAIGIGIVLQAAALLGFFAKAKAR